MRIPQKWMSEELRLGFLCFFSDTYRVPELLGFEMFWTLMKKFEPQHVLLTLGTAGCWHRNISASVWSTTSWVWRLLCFVEPLGVSNHYCHEDFKSPITKRCEALESQQGCSMRGRYVYSLFWSPGNTICVQKMDNQTKIDILNCSTCSRISCVHALERIWTCCDLANPTWLPFLVTFGAQIDRIEGLYSTYCVFVPSKISLEITKYIFSVFNFCLHTSYIFAHSKTRVYRCATTCLYVYRRLHAYTHCCFLRARLPYLRKVAGALKNVLAIAAGICEVASLVIVT